MDDSKADQNAHSKNDKGNAPLINGPEAVERLQVMVFLICVSELP
ncbi:Uncharacterised protein [Mycobacteroides abscessus subsp. abscessus]|nr:Uncharacterised protein [Mycobacteroides abscessus subsp. abscessus]